MCLQVRAHAYILVIMKLKLSGRSVSGGNDYGAMMNVFISMVHSRPVVTAIVLFSLPSSLGVSPPFQYVSILLLNPLQLR